MLLGLSGSDPGADWPSITETSWYTISYSAIVMSFDTHAFCVPTIPLRSWRIRSMIMRFSARSLELPRMAWALSRSYRCSSWSSA